MLQLNIAIHSNILPLTQKSEPWTNNRRGLELSAFGRHVALEHARFKQVVNLFKMIISSNSYEIGA